MLPEPDSRGAALTVRYCVQCHNLPNPAMQQAAKWPAAVERMVARMRGQGNMGRLMHEMMAGVKAPARTRSACCSIPGVTLRRSGARWSRG